MSETLSYLQSPQFRREISRWSIFALIYAVPCFTLAKIAEFTGTAANLAMFTGILTWIGIMTYLTTHKRWQEHEDTMLGKSLHFARIARAILAGLSILGILGSFASFGSENLYYLSHLDHISGSAAVNTIQVFGVRPSGVDASFLATFTATMITGLGIFITIAALTVLIWSALKIGEWLKVGPYKTVEIQ